VRRDFGQPRLPWVVVQIGRVIGDAWDPAPWNSIQEQQRRLPERIKHLAVVPAVDLELDDSIHISARDHAVLGARVAVAADHLTLGNSKEKGPIRLKSVRAAPRPAGDGLPATCVVEARFSNVVGGLRSAGRPVGFALTNAAGAPVSAFYKTRLQGSRAILETAFGVAALEGMSLHYGYGLDPAANITDARGMGLPVFGPVPVLEATGTPFILKWKVRRAKPGAGSLRSLSLRDLRSTRRWTEGVVWPMPEGEWLVMPKAMEEPRVGTFFLRGTVHATAPRRVTLAFGADSPFKVWFNGVEAIRDLAGANPCMPDEYLAEVSLKKGRNEIVVAFDARDGQGWGICARFKPVAPEKKLPKEELRFD